MRFLAFILALLFAVPAFGATCTTPPALTDIDNTFTRQTLTEDTNFDATGDIWTCAAAVGNTDCNNTYHIDGGAYDFCSQGGLVRWTNDTALTRTDMYTNSGGGGGVRLVNQGVAALYDMRVHNTFDGLRLVPTSFDIQGVWLSYIRDDCIENDGMRPGTVDDSLFDGCYVFLSSRNNDPQPYTGDVTVQNSLIFMEAMPGPDYNAVIKNDPDYFGYGATIKYQAQSPPLNLHNNVFLMDDIDDPDQDWREPAFLGFPAALNNCSGNLIVWIGDGDFPGNIPSDTSCVTVTTDITVWYKRKYQWITEHPNIQRPAPEPTAAFTYSCTNLGCVFTDTSTDPESAAMTYQWYFDTEGTSTSQNPSFTFSAGGTYDVILVVTDAQGYDDVIVTSVTVEITPPGPVIDTTAPTISLLSPADEAVYTTSDTISIFGSATDDQQISSVRIDTARALGQDRTGARVKSISSTQIETSPNLDTASISHNIRFRRKGGYIITVVVTDSSNNRTEQSVYVDVTN